MYRDESLRRELTNNAYRDLIASGQYSYRQFINTFDEELIKSGLSQKIDYEMTKRIDAQFQSFENLQMKKLLQAKHIEFDDIYLKYIALQTQYMEQQTELNDIYSKYLALQTQYTEQQAKGAKK
jgi:N-methylhydantoinase A/oxoprolinase/acetone carboxylase beta subunit